MYRKGKNRIAIAIIATALYPSIGNAQSVMQIHRNDGVTLLTDITTTDSVDFSKDTETAYFHLASVVGNVPIAEIDSITFGTSASEVQINYSENGITAVNPYAFRGLDLTICKDGLVTVTSALTDEITYRLSGKGIGAFKLYSSHKQVIHADGLQITSPIGAAINIQSKKKTTFELVEGTANTLTDAAAYTETENEDQKGTFFSEGQIVFEGEGSLTVKGNYKHAICSDDYIRVKSGSITINNAATDGIHAKDYFQMDGGTITILGTTGDCIDADEGYVEVNGGTLNLTASTADTKALKCDSTMAISGGTFNINLNADQTKGLKSGCHMDLRGGTLTFNCTGGVVVTDSEPSYCTAIKCDSTINLTGANITITHSGTAGKGISTDLDFNMTSGTLNMTMTGNGGTYTNTSNQSDTYSSTGLKVDGKLFIQEGNITIKNSGSGGKCISTKGVATYGDDSHSPNINVATTGTKINSSSSGGGRWWAPQVTATTNAPGGGGPGGGGPGGGGNGGGPGGQDSSGGGNPKAIRGEGNVIVNNGTFTISTQNDGGEGIESKQTLTINGGTIECNTYDDALQAANAIVINGGNIYAYASNNDGIDSNGTLTITGGFIVASGTSAPEEGFDCDQNTFAITGGTLVGFGGSTSTPTTSACSQCSVVWSNATASNGLVYTVCDSDGNQVMSFTMPRAYGSATILFSTPELAQSKSYTIYTGGTISGGTSFHGLTTGATYTKGTQKKTFTTSSRVTSLR